MALLQYPVTIAAALLLAVQLLAGAWGSHVLASLLAAALAAEVGILPWLRGLSSRELDGTESRVRNALSGRGGEVWARFQEHLRAGGDASRFSDQELLIIFQGREDELLAAPALSSESSLMMIRSLAERTIASSGTGPLLQDKVLLACAGSPALSDEILGIYGRAGRIEALLTQVLGSQSGEPRLAFAGSALRCDRPAEALRLLEGTASPQPQELALKRTALTRLGRSDEAVSILLLRPRPEWSSDDHALALQSFVRAGDRQGASDEFKEFQNHCGPGRYPEAFYAYADFCERTGQKQSAESVFKRFLDSNVSYRDVPQRYSRLQSLHFSADGLDTILAPAAASTAGARLIAGKFELRQRIGEGGMGEVFAGFDLKLQRPVAIKKMRSELRSDPRLRDRFFQEARIVSQLSHPYIVKLQDIADETEGLFLVLDFVAGKTLSQLLYERTRLTPAECRQVLEPVCQAVEYAHAQRVLHRDLKPSNIMITATGFPMVMDFGLARQVKESLSQLTRQDVSGTPAYMAPEQHLGKADESSDVYSLGVCLYEMLTGEIPFKGADLLTQKERMAFDRPSARVPGLPAAADALIASALAARPEDRIRIAAQFLDELKGLG